jgi:hypothetical protein
MHTNLMCRMNDTHAQDRLLCCAQLVSAASQHAMLARGHLQVIPPQQTCLQDNHACATPPTAATHSFGPPTA